MMKKSKRKEYKWKVYKRIAAEKMIEVVGKDFIRHHIDHIACSYCDTGDMVKITFLVYQPSDTFEDKSIIKDESSIERYFEVIINKKTKKCIEVDNKL